MNRLRWRLSLGLLGFTLASPTFATPFESIGWGVDARALFTMQANEDTVAVSGTIAGTRNAVCAIEQRMPIDQYDKMLMVRLTHAYPTTWFLYRTGSMSGIAKLESNVGNGWISFSSGEVASFEWEALFAKFAKYEQKPPTPPRAANAPLRSEYTWPRGFSGVANVYDAGNTREFLLPTNEVHGLREQGLIEAFLCSTVFSGMHCKVGATIENGWVVDELEQLYSRKSVSTLPAALARFAHVQAVDLSCREPAAN